MRTNKDRQRARKQARRRKVHYLRARLAQATNRAERQRLIAKIRLVSPDAPISEE
jgi:hypothetical protein